MSDADHLTNSRVAIQILLEQAGISSFEASVKMGRNRTNFDDFIKGRKKSISTKVADQLAMMLNVHSDYISGEIRPPVDKRDVIPYLDQSRRIEKLKIEIEKVSRQIEKTQSSNINAVAEDAKNAFEMYAETGAYQAILERLLEELDYLMMIENRAVSVESKWIFPKSFVNDRLRTAAENIFVFEVFDASMSGPNSSGLRVGDQVIVDGARHDYRNGGIFAVRDGSDLYLRQTELLSSGSPARLRFTALNPEFSTFEAINGHEVDIVGRVVAFIRQM